MSTLRVLTVTSQLPGERRCLDMAPLARQIESLRRSGVDVEVLQVRGVKRWKYLQALPALRRLAKRADVLHAHYAFCGWLARTRLFKPVVCSFMGDDLLGTPDAHGRVSAVSKAVVQASRILARRLDAVIVKSAEMARIVAPVTAHVIPNGVDLDAFQPIDAAQARAALGWTNDRPYVLFAGNPQNPRKGYDLAQKTVAAAKTLGPARAEIVTLWGVDPAQVPLYMNACDAMLMTSWLEGSPNVVKEAMACNVPIVSVPVGDVAELLDGVEGCEVCPRDPGLLGKALAASLVQRRRSAGRAALRRKGLDLESVAQRVIGVYEEALARKRPAGGAVAPPRFAASASGTTHEASR